MAYVSIQERFGSRIRTILAGGAQYDTSGPVEEETKRRAEFRRDETFPMYEDRSVRPDPLGLRYTFPCQAFGLKSTVDFAEKMCTASDSSEEEIRVMHEVGVEDFDVVLDSQSWSRIIRFILIENGPRMDPR